MKRPLYILQHPTGTLYVKQHRPTGLWTAYLRTTEPEIDPATGELVLVPIEEHPLVKQACRWDEMLQWVKSYGAIPADTRD